MSPDVVAGLAGRYAVIDPSATSADRPMTRA